MDETPCGIGVAFDGAGIRSKSFDGKRLIIAADFSDEFTIDAFSELLSAFAGGDVFLQSTTGILIYNFFLF